MGWNGSGTFSITTSGTPVVTGTTISSTVQNNFSTELATGINNTLTKDGQNVPTANVSWGGFRLTSLGAATLVSDAARASQVQNYSMNTLTSVAGTNTITASVTPTPAAYAEGQIFTGILLNTITAQATLNVSSLGAQPIFLGGTTATASSLRSRIPISFAYISTTSSTGFHVLGYSGFQPQFETGVVNSTFTFNGSGGTTASKAMTWQKNGNYVTLNIPTCTVATGTNSSQLVSDTALPVAIRPAAGQTAVITQMTDNAGSVAPAGMLQITTGGVITIFRDGAGTNFTNSAVAGMSNNQTITYFIG